MSWQPLIHLLNGEIYQLKQLLHALSNEATALLCNESGSIELATNAKKHALEKQIELTMVREKAMEEVTGYSGDDTLSQLANNTEDTRLKQLILELRELAKQCRETNQANGKLIHKQQRHTNNALNILRQRDAPPATYTNQGSTNQVCDSRTIGKA
ncbi:flagella synthesis protein FlgN [Porticoccus sp.]